MNRLDPEGVAPPVDGLAVVWSTEGGVGPADGSELKVPAEMGVSVLQAMPTYCAGELKVAVTVVDPAAAFVI
jgi:hypothetical protein